MFGKGVYLTEVASKAGMFCHASAAQPFGFLILARVAVGKELCLTKPDASLGDRAYRADGCAHIFSFSAMMLMNV
jgi:hypothetical protein